MPCGGREPDVNAHFSLKFVGRVVFNACMHFRLVFSLTLSLKLVVFGSV